MNLQGRLDRVEALFAKDDLQGAGRTMSELFEDLRGAPPAGRAAALEAVAGRLAGAPPVLAAHLATLGGAIVEMEVPARPLARALVGPVRDALASGRRFLERVARATRSEEPDAVAIGPARVARREMLSIEAEDPGAIQGFFSLETWYLPAVAAWTRDVDTLREVQRDAAFRANVEAIGGMSEGTHWLSLILATLIDAPLIFLVPEVGEAYSLKATGVVDCGQLSVLLSEALSEPLARIGCPGVALEHVLAVMRGEGAAQIEDSFTAAFHLYPWRAMNPASTMPEDGRFEWLSPGGAGKHSLPPDFLPGKIEPLRGARVLALVGSAAPGGIRFVRSIGAARMFEALRAELTDVRRLTPAETRSWYDAVRTALSN